LIDAYAKLEYVNVSVRIGLRFFQEIEYVVLWYVSYAKFNSPRLIDRKPLRLPVYSSAAR